MNIMNERVKAEKWSPY